MVRSSWIGPVIVGLAVTGLAWSQTGSPALPPAETKERTLTLQEAQRPAQKCKLLRSWCQPNGAKAYLVQSLNTGEFITIAEIADASGSSKAVATKIYHWGDGQKPPADTPALPNNALILGEPIARFGKALPPPTTTMVQSNLPPMLPPLPPSPALVKQEMPPPVPLRTDSKLIPPAITPTPATPTLPKPPALVKQETLPPVPLRTDSKPTPPTLPPSPALVKQETPPSVPLRTDFKPASVPVTTSLPDSTALVSSMGPSLSPLPVQPAEAPAVIATSKAPESDLVIIVPLPNTPDNKSPQPMDSKPVAPSSVAADNRSTPPVIATKSAQLSMPVTMTLNQTPEPGDWRQSWGRVDAPANSSAPLPTSTPSTAQAPIVPAQSVEPFTTADHSLVTLPTLVKADTKLSGDSQPVVNTGPVGNPPAMTKGSTPVVSPVADKTPVQVAWNTASGCPPATPPACVTCPPIVACVPSATPCSPTVSCVPPATPCSPCSPPATPCTPCSPCSPTTPCMPCSPSATCVPSATPCSPTKTYPPVVGSLPSTMSCLPPPPPPPPPAPKPTLPPGMQSVAAARQVQPGVQNVQIAEGPNAFSPPAKKGEDQVASQAAPLPQMSCPPGPMPMMVPSAPMDSGISPALANAFTLPGTTRPIPANFGPPAQIPNAFSEGNTGPVAYGPLPLPTLANPQIPIIDRGPVPVRVVSVSSPIQGAGNPQYLVAILRDSLYPSQREDAAQALANQDWRAQPQFVEALVKAAKEDPAPMVRAECVHSLAHMGAATLPVVKVCQALKADPDPRVRKEAEQALLALVGSRQYDEALFQPTAGRPQK